MSDIDELKAIIKASGLTMRRIAKGLGISEASMHRRLRAGVFEAEQLAALCELLSSGKGAGERFTAMAAVRPRPKADGYARGGQRRCRSCRYFSRRTFTCDYILDEGRRRPCPPGDACEVYRAGVHRSDYMRRLIERSMRQCSRSCPTTR